MRIEGSVEKITKEESDEYFLCRGKGSQIGAWASDQSRPIRSREELEEKEKVLIEKYKD